MDNKLAQYLTGFRRLHDTQHSLLTMHEKWILIKKKIPCFIYGSLKSFAFDAINHVNNY